MTDQSYLERRNMACLQRGAREGLDLKGLSSEQLKAITYEVTERGKVSKKVLKHQTVGEWCEWLQQLVSCGPLPEDCKRHVIQIYENLDSDYQREVREIRTNLDAGTYRSTSPTLDAAVAVAE